MPNKNKSEKKKTKRINKPLIQMIIGLIILFIGVVLLLSFTSYLINWRNDQSQITAMGDKAIIAENVFGKMGAWLGHFFIYDGVGIVAFLLPVFLIFLGVRISFKWKPVSLKKLLYHFLFFTIWLPLFFNFTFSKTSVLGGRMGFELKDYLKALIDNLGILFLLIITFLIYTVVEWKITPDKLNQKLKKAQSDLDTEPEAANSHLNSEPENISEKPESKTETTPFTGTEITNEELEPQLKAEEKQTENQFSFSTTTPTQPPKKEEAVPKHDEIFLTVETVKEEEVIEKTSSEKLVDNFGEYDPRLDLAKFQIPPLNLLKEYTNSNVTIDQRELEANKDRIVETLGNYGIKIDSIKATIGPTVTLYEIVPEAGIRISKIKNLEDDIALSLSALGIRIIAPIPGKGTIGIEVPNSNPTIVSMHSVISSQKFQNAKMELPIAFGKTISNETFVADLAKMPHMLMAGATGQGKSVGLNAIITSLLYKKHPAELKFVMVDPKKVELALYNKIERHYLAKLPDSEDAIITDNTKVINTLNSLCIEMDQRYELLKDALVRNIKEYNEKFKHRKLNPENGHRFLPYIVLVVDEFADLIMTAGKEVETPIARLAQLARAVGIHLIVATQRPSVNVITGIIKANFPARVAFRVTSKVDSRTILDTGGADQLIGKGDMLYTKGNDLVRLQCAFVDTPEVEKIADYVGDQKGYPDAFMLPEYVGEESGSLLDFDADERDALFEDAARVLVAAQQGSTSLLQRKMKIGYNRAGRIIDQLEAAGIVGSFEGSKAREVLVTDEMSLEQLLDNLKNNS